MSIWCSSVRDLLNHKGFWSNTHFLTLVIFLMLFRWAFTQESSMINRLKYKKRSQWDSASNRVCFQAFHMVPGILTSVILKNRARNNPWVCHHWKKNRNKQTEILTHIPFLAILSIFFWVRFFSLFLWSKKRCYSRILRLDMYLYLWNNDQVVFLLPVCTKLHSS